MSRTIENRLKEAFGRSHFVEARVRKEQNSDGMGVVWIDVVYRDLIDGPDVTTMNLVVNEAWDAFDSEDVTPIVNFVSVEEDRPLAAAE